VTTVTHTTSSQPAPRTSLALAVCVGVPPSLFIFAGTFFADSTRHGEHEPVSYRASVMDGIAFTTSMGWLNDVVLPKQGLFIRLSKASGIGLLEVSPFFVSLPILFANALGE
jgi:hypothetical protein